jgi:lipopolysaccharide exporter
LNDIDKKIAAGAAWMVSLKMVDRGLGLVSTIVLARLLLPEDFGLVAMAMLLIGAMQLLISFSFDVSLIQNPHAGRDQFDTAWTFTALFSVVCAAMLALAAPAAAEFYREPRLQDVIYLLAAGFALQGFSNIGTVHFRRDMRFDLEFKFLLGKRLSSLFVTLPLAFLLQSYWALVIGQFSGTLMSVALSYMVSDYRPRLSLRARSELYHSSKWLVANNILQFMNGRAVELIISRMAGPQALGIYTISAEISTLPSTDLVAPMNRAAFPGYAKVASRKEELRSSFLHVISMIALIALPAGIGILSVADIMVPLVFGPAWLGAVPLIQVLAVYGVIQALQTNIHYVYMAIGENRIITYLASLQLMICIGFLVIGIRHAGASGAAWALLATAVCMIPVNQVLIARRLELGALTFLQKLMRPLLASAVMGAAVWAIKSSLSAQMPGFALLLLCVAAGAALYAGTLYLLWNLAAQPAGPERLCFARAETALRGIGLRVRLVRFS